MLLSVNEMRGFSIHASDGDIGRVEDFYFDDQHWTIRYMVADVGSWLEGRSVLVSPVSIGMIAPDLKRFMASLTKEQIENSPDWDSKKPVSRRYEELFADHYQHVYYWGGPLPWGGAIYPAGAADRAARQQAEKEAAEEIGRSNLRSTSEVSSYRIESRDGEIGSVNDFIIDDKTWQIHYLVVDTGKWLSGRKVIISPRWIDSIDWAENHVAVSLSKETIKNAPNYESPATITREYEKRLFAYYGRPPYWEAAARR